ncbi:MAG: JAB domain-containing protein [Nitriliruptoraceae bacterium]
MQRASDHLATRSDYQRGPATGDVPSTVSAVCPHRACHDRWHPDGGRDRPALTSPEAAAAVLAAELAGADRERCVAALLDTKHRLLAVVTVSIGSLDHTFMSPREVFRDALLANAAAMVLAHNHPSGDPEPSGDDELLTRRLVRAGELIGVEVLDHLVVGGREWISLARRGVV